MSHQPLNNAPGAGVFKWALFDFWSAFWILRQIVESLGILISWLMEVHVSPTINNAKGTSVFSSVDLVNPMVHLNSFFLT